MVLVGMVDVLMVATLGETSISAVSLVDSLNYLFLMILSALAAGGTVICARFVGMKEDENAAKAGGQFFFITIILLTLIMIFILIFNRSILRFMFGKVEKAVIDEGVLYLIITSFSLPFLAIYHSTAAVFRAKGKTRISMLMSIFMNVINIAGNALGAGLLIIIGQCYGAKEFGQARYYLKKLLIVNYVIIAIIGSAMYVFLGSLIGWYSLVGTSAALAKGLIISHSGNDNLAVGFFISLLFSRHRKSLVYNDCGSYYHVDFQNRSRMGLC
ncbi:MatE protein [Acetitomaculum ruminis DSM 5522]|uniref:Probable multidrug resistance protein NorM n=2 Tax=Acetitomaculum ruminis TaxID=2382 RepID=A0A1I0W2Y9_9FIRM|nr:MatE protein [Acetitomaculum ruminis DSM 5522]